MTNETDLPIQAAGDDGAQTDGQGPRSLWLILGALALIAVPVFGGYFLIQNKSAPTSASSVGTDAGMDGSEALPTSDLPSGVLPFADIQANEITIEPDPAGGGAVLRVNTVTDVACAVPMALRQIWDHSRRILIWQVVGMPFTNPSCVGSRRVQPTSIRFRRSVGMEPSFNPR